MSKANPLWIGHHDNKCFPATNCERSCILSIQLHLVERRHHGVQHQDVGNYLRPPSMISWPPWCPLHRWDAWAIGIIGMSGYVWNHLGYLRMFLVFSEALTPAKPPHALQRNTGRHWATATWWLDMTAFAVGSVWQGEQSRRNANKLNTIQTTSFNCVAKKAESTSFGPTVSLSPGTNQAQLCCRQQTGILQTGRLPYWQVAKKKNCSFPLSGLHKHR